MACSAARIRSARYLVEHLDTRSRSWDFSFGSGCGCLPCPSRLVVRQTPRRPENPLSSLQLRSGRGRERRPDDRIHRQSRSVAADGDSAAVEDEHGGVARTRGYSSGRADRGDAAASDGDGGRRAVARRRSSVVEGEAGIGKSRLVREATLSLATTEDALMIGHGVDLAGGELPFGVVADALRDLIRREGVPAVRAASPGSVRDPRLPSSQAWRRMPAEPQPRRDLRCVRHSGRDDLARTDWCGWWPRTCIGRTHRAGICWRTSSEWSGRPSCWLPSRCGVATASLIGLCHAS